MNLHNPSNPSLVYRKKINLAMTGDEPAAYLAARAGIDNVDDRLRTRMAAFSACSHAGRASAPWFGMAGRRTVVSGRRRGRRGDGGVRAALATVVWTGRRWCRGGVEGGGAAASGEERGRGSRARARERGDRLSNRYIHTNGAPHPGAPLVFFFCSSQQVIFHLT